MLSLFQRKKELIMKIDNFLDLTSEAGLHFREAVKLYLEKRDVEFNERLKIISNKENEADNIRKDIEAQLYTQTLIPESRGDVLGILESMDSIIDLTKLTTMQFSVESPVIPGEINQDILELLDIVLKAVESLVCAVRAFFYDINAVKDHLHLVKFYEKEADGKAERILRRIFKLEIDLSRKIHLRFFTNNIDSLADRSEDVSNRLAIATIKRVV